MVTPRNGRPLIWFRGGEVGDILTDAKSARFEWVDDGSKVSYLPFSDQQRMAASGMRS